MRAPTIGKIQNGFGHVTKFPVGDPRKGKFIELQRDYCEELISPKEDVPFADDPGFAERIYDKAMLKTYMRENGQLPPREVAEPTAAEKKVIDEVVAKAGATA